jgi:hypothetical protein
MGAEARFAKRLGAKMEVAGDLRRLGWHELEERGA